MTKSEWDAEIQSYMKGDIYATLSHIAGKSLKRQKGISNFINFTKTDEHCKLKLKLLAELKPLCNQFQHINKMYKNWKPFLNTTEGKDRAAILKRILLIWSEREERTWGTN